MKREVASSLVERGVAERVRLTQAYEKKKAELVKQHDIVKAAFQEHKAKVNDFKDSSLNSIKTIIFSFFKLNFQARALLEKETDSKSCISSEGFLALFNQLSIAESNENHSSGDGANNIAKSSVSTDS